VLIVLIEIENFKRKNIFERYHSCDNPFIFITVKIDVTNAVNYCKINKNFYATMGYCVTKAVNQIEEFKYRYVNGKFYYCDNVKTNYTQMHKDGSIGYFDLSQHKDNYSEYIEMFLKDQKDFLEKNEYNTSSKYDEIWVSCSPWLNFSSLITPYDKNMIIPQFIWDKYYKENDKYYVNMMIMVHHGFADGSHIGKFISKLEEEIRNFNK
jgi:chloramphenicol O-acetyltransferase